MKDIETGVEFDTNTNAAYRCPRCGGHNCELVDAKDFPLEGYLEGAHLPAKFYCNDCKKEYDVNFVLGVDEGLGAEGATE